MKHVKFKINIDFVSKKKLKLINPFGIVDEKSRHNYVSCASLTRYLSS